MRTGRDVVMAALLGADEFSFGTAAVVAEGCQMARACHLNTCPVGIATQRPELRAKFDATPEHIMTFMIYVAQEVREVLASLGLRSVDEAVGRAELLKQLEGGSEVLDLSRLLLIPPGKGPRHYVGDLNRVSSDSPLNDQLVSDSWDCFVAERPMHIHYHISNRDRTFGARLAGEIAKRRGDSGLPDGLFNITLEGSAGQSFGAFGVPGLNLSLCGEANDYVGKGLAGGRIVIYPSAAKRYIALPVLAGNTVLYGATGGEVFIAGRAGERFAVRNSGAVAIVEGVGDHGCEYMTGGLVIVLGPVGYNFAAGMTGGIAYVLDEDGHAATRINTQLVRAETPGPNEVEGLQDWLALHTQLTSSQKAQAILRDWPENSAKFLRVVPKDPPALTDPVVVRSFAVAEPVLRN
jgi:glutamate synthase (ferredoxin)